MAGWAPGAVSAVPDFLLHFFVKKKVERGKNNGSFQSEQFIEVGRLEPTPFIYILLQETAAPPGRG